ncbi:MAG: hypothetical protein NZT92_17020, partial [Abditibacteriales bacterium]|nr:hypothetical protein [Abditibacteriales bacterium]MDW8367577.1 hypothetical protein [Abditibacteriales bacterium]
DYPQDGRLFVPGLKNKVASAYLLADPHKNPLRTQVRSDGVVVSVPAQAPDPICSVVVLKVKGALDIEQPLLTQSADGSLTLPAIEALLHGEMIQYESGHNRNNIGFWTNPNDWVEWEFNVTKPGKFNVTAEIAALGSGSFHVIVGNQRLKGTAPTTGDYGKFQTVSLGVIELPAPGKTSLSVKPIRDGWQPMNLRAIRLTPVS